MVTPKPEELRQQIKRYLIAQAESGNKFVKSRHISDYLDVSAKRVGQAICALEAEEQVTLGQQSISLHRWGGKSDGVTWYIEVSE
ncbi:hypothetical protein GCM10009037_30600 [Halarchaeum grantii]|uniref:DUF7123 domain-containing protein n=1 Tax=Halarchaeum grantii TaxID=1193105 RepID=A0A830F6A3_9EURY|nr:hypothetical protein GCM10009037_30600 [Halarchaeum grantii]